MEHVKYAISVLKSEVFNLNKELYELQLTKNQEDNLKQDIEKLSKAIQAIKNSFGLDKVSANDI